MSQIFKGDKVVPVTAIQIVEKPEGVSLKSGDVVKITGTSKGKGFQGVVKRWNFGGGPQTRGQKNRLRAPGSIGNTTPQRVIKGRHMAGHMGLETVTLINKLVVEFDDTNNTALIKGAIPGWKGKALKIYVTPAVPAK